jgi:uncharacterized protein
MNNTPASKINMKQFEKKVAANKTAFKRFLTKLEKQNSQQIYDAAVATDAIVWKEIDCLSCGNCCKKNDTHFYYR